MQALECLSICNRHGVALHALTYSKYLISEKNLQNSLYYMTLFMHTHTHIHTYIHIYIYIYIYICDCIKKIRKTNKTDNTITSVIRGYLCLLPFTLCAWLLSHVWLFATPWTVAQQAPLSMGFSRQEYWSGLPCPPPGDLPVPGIEPRSPRIAGGFFTSWATREAYCYVVWDFTI